MHRKKAFGHDGRFHFMKLCLGAVTIAAYTVVTALSLATERKDRSALLKRVIGNV
ncbi:hypothetical protein [Desulfosoma sp.]|uniref:hypothetical protein n=1 Tax=Desulfosoma sp. TaxID=2603217 RepID=UPI00404A456B